MKRVKPMDEKITDFTIFTQIISDSQDLKLEDKIKVLDYVANECYIKDDTFKYLECKLVIKELRDGR